MCEPFMLARTGLSVVEHQLRTVENYVQLRDRAPDLPFAPVLQGWCRDDYHRCIEMYQQAGADLTAEPLVGVGSVCRRQATGEIEAIVHSLASLGLRFHGFGVKAGGLVRYADCLESADSLAWSSRRGGRRRRVRFRRTRCRACRATHVLVPTTTLLRRLDLVDIIGAALLAKATGHGHRRITVALGLPATTVRGWLLRFSRRAGELWARAAQLAHRYDVELGPIAARGSPTADAVEALGVSARAVVLRFGPLLSTPWQVISALTDALMLSIATLPER